MGCCQAQMISKSASFTKCANIEELYYLLNEEILRINSVCNLISTNYENDNPILLEKIPSSVNLQEISDSKLLNYYENLKRHLLVGKIFIDYECKLTGAFSDKILLSENPNIMLIARCLNDIMRTEQSIDYDELMLIKRKEAYSSIFNSTIKFEEIEEMDD